MKKSILRKLREEFISENIIKVGNANIIKDKTTIVSVAETKPKDNKKKKGEK